jgi:hypothetical protein
MGIEIQPDGTPIRVPDTPNEPDKKVTSDFVAQVMESQTQPLQTESLSEKADVKPVETIPATGPGNPTPQHNHLVDSARKFNENLTLKNRVHEIIGDPPTLKLEVNARVMADIRLTLKDNGMDTQQQEHALQRIGEILQEEVARQSREE